MYGRWEFSIFATDYILYSPFKQRIMKKGIFITLCLLGLIRMTTTACPPENGNQQDIPLSALQAKLAGTYVPIFSEQGINAPKWDQLWISETAKYTGIEIHTRPPG